MLGQRHELARLQSDFYRDQFRKLLRWVIITLFIIFLLLGIVIYAILLYRPVIHYYANTVDGKILNMPAPRM